MKENKMSFFRLLHAVCDTTPLFYFFFRVIIYVKFQEIITPAHIILNIKKEIVAFVNNFGKEEIQLEMKLHDLNHVSLGQLL